MNSSRTLQSTIRTSLKRSFQRQQARECRVVTGNSFVSVDNRAALRNASFSSSSSSSNDSPFTKNTSAATTKLRKFVPRKAAVHLTESARTFFRKLLQHPPRPEIIGILLSYKQATDQVKMVFHFEFITEVPDMAEGVSLELLEDGTPKPPDQSQNDGLPKLYLHPDAFLKVLGATVDVDPETKEIKLLDREGNALDPDY